MFNRGGGGGGLRVQVLIAVPPANGVEVVTPFAVIGRDL